MTNAFGIVTADFGNESEIGHHQLKTSVTFIPNKRSRSIETTGHGEPKYAIADEPLFISLRGTRMSRDAIAFLESL